MGDPSDAIGLLVQRHDLLDVLLDGPRAKRDLESALGVSRSTVDRGVRDLELARYIRRTNDGYALTLSGRLALESYREYTTTIHDAETAADALRPLDADAPIPASFVAGAGVAQVDATGRHDPPAPIRTVLREADAVRAVLPQVSMRTPARWYERVVERGRSTTVLLPPGRYRELTETVPGLIHGLTDTDGTHDTRGGTKTRGSTDTRSGAEARGSTDTRSGTRTRGSTGTHGSADALGRTSGDADGGQFRALAADVPEYGIVLATDAGGTTAYLLAYANGRPHGVLWNDDAAAVEWAAEVYDQLAAGATDVTADLQGATAGTVPRFARRSSRASLAAQGFIELTEAYFADREPSASCFQTGLGLVEVAAGYAIDREYVPGRDDRTPALVAADDEPASAGDPDGGDRRNLTDDLFTGLRSGADHVVIGPPGAGKSTVCKQVACRWHDAGDPVFYRESGAGAAFTETGELAERLRSVDGDALVVVEDAVRTESNAVFRLLREFRDADDVVFLLDARENEWRSPESFPLDAELDRYRIEAVETVEMPSLDDRECERIVERFESVVGHRVDRTSADLLGEVRADENGGGPDELLLLLHRLSRYVDSLSGATDAPTSFVEDVHRAVAAFSDDGSGAEGLGDVTLDVAVLLNLLNAAGLGARPELAYALGEPSSYAAVTEALAALEGRVLFTREDGTPRSVHESWSGLFLDRLLDVEGERQAADRVGRAVSALLALADDPARRERIEWELGGDAPAIDSIEDDPTEWADSTVTALFTFPVNYPAVAPLFGSTEDDHIELPAACSDGIEAQCIELRGRMQLRAGNHDRAEREFDRLGRFDDRGVRATRHKWLGTVARLRSEFDAAEDRFEAALDDYIAQDDRRGIADCLSNLGAVALQRGALEDAESYLDRSLEIHRELGNVRAEADLQFNLATTYDSLGDVDAAIEFYEACLESYRDVGSRRDVADVLNNLGVAHKNRGDVERAAGHYARSLETYRELGDRVGVANALFNLSVIDRRRGDLDTAEERHADALERYRSIGDRQGEAEVLNSLCDVARRRNQHDRAEELARQEREIREEIGDILGCGSAHLRLAEVALDRGEPETARDFGRTALEYYEQGSGTLGILRANRVLARADVRQESFEDAAERLQTALAGCRDHGYRYTCAQVHTTRAELALARDDLDAARAAYEAALEGYEESGAVLDVIETLRRLADTVADLGDVERARQYCDRALTEAQAAAVDPSILDGPSLESLTTRIAGLEDDTTTETD